MKQWHKQYYQDLAAEQQAKRRAAAENIGHYYTWDGEEMIAWPNGETSPASEYEHWLAGRALVAQYGEHG